MTAEDLLSPGQHPGSEVPAKPGPAHYVYGDRLLSMNSAGGVYYFHHDALGTTAAITKSTGATQWTYTYDPYGVARTTTKVDPTAPDNPIQYAGELIDTETGLYDLRARTYAPGDGRFLSSDRIPEDAGDPAIGDYVYVNDMPIVAVDPSGNRVIADAGVDGGRLTRNECVQLLGRASCTAVRPGSDGQSAPSGGGDGGEADGNDTDKRKQKGGGSNSAAGPNPLAIRPCTTGVGDNYGRDQFQEEYCGVPYGCVNPPHLATLRPIGFSCNARSSSTGQKCFSNCSQGSAWALLTFAAIVVPVLAPELAAAGLITRTAAQGRALATAIRSATAAVKEFQETVAAQGGARLAAKVLSGDDPGAPAWLGDAWRSFFGDARGLVTKNPDSMIAWFRSTSRLLKYYSRR